MKTDLRERLDHLISKNQVKYYHMAFSYMKNKDDALDVLHNAIIKAVENYPKLRNEKYMDTWFCRILINECLIFLKKKEKESPLENIEQYLWDEPEPMHDDLSDYLYMALKDLDDDLRHIVILRYFNGMKIEEIAHLTNTNLSTTKSRLYKALAILKKKMEDMTNEE